MQELPLLFLNGNYAVLVFFSSRKGDKMKSIEYQNQKIQCEIGEWDELAEYAHDQYTDYGNEDKEKIEITLLEWFDSQKNDDYLVMSDDGEWYILLSSSSPIAYPAHHEDIKKVYVIGNQPAE